MRMPNVQRCDVGECAYNGADRCHANAITVGGPAPCCGTFMDSPKKGGAEDPVGNVGACKIEDCAYNEMLQCMAPGIVVSRQSCLADCLTFKSARKGGDGYV
jgi:hypothetical protein